MIFFHVYWNVTKNRWWCHEEPVMSTMMLMPRPQGEKSENPSKAACACKKKSKPQKQTMNVDNDTASANELEQFGVFFLLQVWRRWCQDTAGLRQLTRSELHQPATSGLAWRRLKNSFTGVLHQYISGSRRRRMKGFGEHSLTPSQNQKLFQRSLDTKG